MPYIEEEQAIYTNILEVTRKGNFVDRQEILKSMKNRPELVNMLFLSGMDIFVQFSTGVEHSIGKVKQKYHNLIRSHIIEIEEWKVTGGHDLPDVIKIIAGKPITLTTKKKAYYGLNVKINLW